MLFTDRVFFLLLACTFGLYYLPARSARYQITVLLIASVIFYAHSQLYLLILLAFSSMIATITSYRVEKARLNSTRRAWAIVGVVVNIFLLAFFKYGRLLFVTTVGQIPSDNGMVSSILALPLPIGISFYTFHGISLVIDVFRAGNKTELPSPLGPERGFADHCQRTFFYLTFFPQLIAGPIVKAKDFYPQMGIKYFCNVNWQSVAETLIVGFFLKSVVADNLAQQTSVLNAPYFFYTSSWNLLVMLWAYAMQIFADFAGYSLIAIGLARLFGYNLPDNFCFPYIAQTFSEFWTRWHMSLSAWLRDYVYYPLGGNRQGEKRTYLNLLLVMVLGGLWHGAGWSYAVWGLWHGTALALERLFRNSRLYLSKRHPAAIARWSIVFVVVTIGWVLFKIPNFALVREFIMALWQNRHMHFSASAPLLAIVYGFPVVLYHLLYKLRHAKNSHFAFAWSPQMRPLLLASMLSALVFQAGNTTPFIYFQF